MCGCSRLESGTVTVTSDGDSEKIETPMVVKAGETYHMYCTTANITI